MFVAGPPASVLVYVLAPEAMVGWIRQPSPAEKEFLAAPARDLPETGRLTGRGDTVSLERLVAAKPDLVVDFGSVTETYVSLANRVQEQTGIPYVLIDGSFADTPASLRLAADMLGRPAARRRARGLCREDLRRGRRRARARAGRQAPARLSRARRRRAWRPAAAARSTPRSSSASAAINVAEGLGGRGNIANASLEQVIAWQPDIIVTLDRAFFQGVKSKPGWDQVRAVEAGQGLPRAQPAVGLDRRAAVAQPADRPALAAATFYPAEARHRPARRHARLLRVCSTA